MSQTIAEVLASLDQIIEQSIQDNNYLGIFAYVYRRTTAQIEQSILAGAFEDNPRMEAFDVKFANYYLDSYQQYGKGNTVAQCWAVAFAAQNSPITNVQHLLLGMNAHINFDLAITANEAMKGQDISSLEHDFKLVNDILASLTNEMQQRLARVSPLFFLLDWLGQNKDEQFIDFSMREARNQSWRTATFLWALGDKGKSEKIQFIDKTIATLGNGIIKPPSRFIRFVLRLIGRFEEKNVAQIINAMRAEEEIS